MITNKREFIVEKDGKEINLVTIRPTQAVRQKGELEYVKAWGNYVKEPGVLLESALWDALRKKNMWDEDKQKELDEIDNRIDENQSMLPDDKGKVKKKGITLNKAREAAIQIRIDRVKRVNILSDFTRLKSNTAEGLSNNSRFNYLVSQCIVYPDTKKPYFDSLENYMERSEDLDANKAAQEFATLYYDYDPDFDKNLPENRFLLKYKMCRDGDLSLIDKDGSLIRADGTKVDENGLPLDPKVEVEEFDVENDWNPEKEVVKDENCSV